MIVVLVAASGAAWESSAMAALDRPGDIVVLKRCVDVDDLLATASSGQAEVAVVALGETAPRWDRHAVDRGIDVRVELERVTRRPGNNVAAGDDGGALAVHEGLHALLRGVEARLVRGRELRRA